MTDAYALQGLILVGLFLFVIYGPWQWACTDAARQFLFHKRDELFDIAREGRLEFASQEYQTIRNAFDSQIRFAHSLSWIRLALFAQLSRRAAGKGNAARSALAQISDEDTRAEIGHLLDALDRTMIVMMIAKSPVLTVLTLFFAFISIIVQVAKRLRENSTRDVRRMLKDAFRGVLALPVWNAPLIHEEAATFHP